MRPRVSLSCHRLRHRECFLIKARYVRSQRLLFSLLDVHHACGGLLILVPSYKVRGKLCAYLLEGTDGVGCQPTELYPCKTLQRSREGLAHDFVCHTLQMHEGFE